MIQLLATVNNKVTFCYNKHDHMWRKIDDKGLDLKNIALNDNAEIFAAFMMFETTFGFTPVKIEYREICLN